MNKSTSGQPGVNGAARLRQLEAELLQTKELLRFAQSSSALLLSIDDALRVLAEPEEITLTAATILGTHLGVSRCAYADVESDQDSFNLTGDFNNGVPSIVGRYTFTQFGAECLRLMRAGQPYIVEDSERDPRTESVRDSYRLTQIRSVVCVPLMKSGQFVGAMAVHEKAPRVWQKSEVDLLLQVASRCWESIERTRIMREHRNWAAVVESSNDAIITKTLDGIITSWNESAERIFGYTKAEVVGKPVTILFPPDHIDEESEIVRRIRNGELVNHYETLRRRKDGTLLPISLTVSPVKNGAGVIVGASKTARDITRQKLYEQQLVDQANELEQFAYVASHDLQEPLRKISVYSDLLVRKFGAQAGPDAEKFCRMISDAVLRMHNLISELLIYSRASRSDMPAANIELEPVLKGVLSDLEISVRESQAEITYDALPSVHANAFQAHQLFQNLLSNAIKFRSLLPPRIHISVQAERKDAVISIQDNGIGIDPQFQERVFRVFQRLHSGERYPGTGIGLAICKKIVERNGGRLWMDSKAGEGSTFHFTLPLPR